MDKVVEVIMTKRYKLAISFLISVILVSCGAPSTNQTIESDGFPLEEHWSYDLGVPIYKLAVTDEIIAVGRSDGVTAIDVETGKLLWSLDFSLATDSRIAFTEDSLIAANSIKKQILIIGKKGEEIKKFNLDSTESFEILAVYSRFVFVRRIPSWNLEVYDLHKGIKAWQIFIGRGSTSISYDLEADIAYVATSSFIGAYNARNGDKIWKFSNVARAGVLDSGTFFYYSEGSKTNNKKAGYIYAMDAQEENQLWSMEIPLQIRTSIYNLTIINDMLVVSTDFGLIAINKIDGSEMWQSETNEFFYGKPIMISDIIFIRGTNTKVIYAISPDDGQYLGCLNLGTPFLISTSQRENDILYKSKQFLIFTFENLVYSYQLK